MSKTSDSLQNYHLKRNFRKTSEPRARKVATSKSGDYMIHLHDATHVHYDLRLQWKGVLISWAVPKGPSLNPDDKRLAVRTEDHPDEYKAFEGVIPDQQYGAGPSLIWDAGDFEPLEDFDEGLKKGRLHFRIDGIKLKGEWVLIRMHSKKKDDTKDDTKENWLLKKIEDDFSSRSSRLLEEWPESVVSGRSVADLKDDLKVQTKKRTQKSDPFPTEVFPQLAVRETKLPRGELWQFERKYDGYRLIVLINRGKVSLRTRNNKDWTHKFPEIADAFKDFPVEQAIFDGEVVHFDQKGQTDFSKLQNFLDENKPVQLQFVVFDALYFEGTSLESYSLNDRRQLLESLWAQIQPDEVLSLSEIFQSDKGSLEKACQLKWEGLIAKRVDGSYHQRRHRSWVKVKCELREEFVVVGLTKPQGSRKYFGSLLIAEKSSEGLKYAGRVGTGFNTRQIKKLFEEFKSKKVSSAPAVKNLNSSGVKMWLKPHFYAEIDFTEKTKTGSLRHPVFRGLRKDKSFRAEVLEETPKIKLTHPSKVLWPSKKITKRDLLNYYEEVMEPLLGFAKEAPLTLVRCPSGISSACFYQKHFEKSTDHPKTISIKEKSKTSEYGFLSTPQDVYALVQIGSLELHLWNSRISDLERPQYVVFDLDPGPGVKFSEVTQTAHLIRAILMEKNLESFARTTGGKGLHVVTPLVESDWESSYEFSKEVAELLSSEMPSRYTAQMAKNKRSKKIFIDYLRNQRGSTSVANFSTRAREGALVATPLFWEEVNEKLDPADFNIKSVPRRLKELKEDPWSEFKLT